MSMMRNKSLNIPRFFVLLLFLKSCHVSFMKINETIWDLFWCPHGELFIDPICYCSAILHHWVPQHSTIFSPQEEIKALTLALQNYVSIQNLNMSCIWIWRGYRCILQSLSIIFALDWTRRRFPKSSRYLLQRSGRILGITGWDPSVCMSNW